MELYRKELKLAVIKGLDESRGSSNVPIKLTHDTSDEYINYTEQIHVRYLLDNQVKEEILPINSSGFYIPGKPLSHDGPIELAVHLINGDIELVTNELSFVVKNAPNGTTQVDPSEFTWQQLVDQYVNAKLDTFANKLDLSKFEETVNGSIENQNQNIESFKTEVNANLSNQDKKITDLQNTTKVSLDSQNTKIDNFKSEVNTSLSNQNTSINQTTSAQNSKITTLEGRMDTFTRLSDGSTTGDAELQDIRVGANGTTYDTAGNAVRGQYSQLKEDLDDLRSDIKKNELPINLLEMSKAIHGSLWTNENGGIYNSGDTNHIRFPMFEVPAGNYYFSNALDKFSYYKSKSKNGKIFGNGGIIFEETTKIYFSYEGSNIEESYFGLEPVDITQMNNNLRNVYNSIDGLNYLVKENVIHGSVWTNENGGIYVASNNARFPAFTLPKGIYNVEGVDRTFSYYKTISGSHGNISEPRLILNEEATIYFSAKSNSETDINACKLYRPSASNHEITIGINEEYTTLKSGIEKAVSIGNCTVYVKDGVYDIIQEYGGNSYFENLTENEVYKNPGLVLGNNIHVIFSSGAKVVCNYTGNNQYVKKHFAPFNADTRTLQMGMSSDFVIENCICEASNVKYVVHDEYNGFDVTYKHIYRNCKFKLDNTNNEYIDTQSSFGGGCGTYGYIELDGCNVIVVPINGVIGTGISWHNANNNYACTDVSNNRLFIKNCVTNGSISFAAYGTSETTSTMTICGSKFHGEPIHEYTNNPPYCTVDNIEIIEWGNTKTN